MRAAITSVSSSLPCFFLHTTKRGGLGDDGTDMEKSKLLLAIWTSKVEAPDGGPPMSHVILRNGNVACHCRLFPPMSHVEFKKRLCPMSLSFLASAADH